MSMTDGRLHLSTEGRKLWLNRRSRRLDGPNLLHSQSSYPMIGIDWFGCEPKLYQPLARFALLFLHSDASPKLLQRNSVCITQRSHGTRVYTFCSILVATRTNSSLSNEHLYSGSNSAFNTATDVLALAKSSSSGCDRLCFFKRAGGLLFSTLPYHLPDHRRAALTGRHLYRASLFQR